MLVPFQSRIEGERMRGKTAAAEDLTAKKELALEVIRRLKAEYPTQAARWTTTTPGSCW